MALIFPNCPNNLLISKHPVLFLFQLKIHITSTTIFITSRDLPLINIKRTNTWTLNKLPFLHFSISFCISDHCFLSLKIKRNIPYAEENTNSSNKRSEETQNPITDESLENLQKNYNKKFIYDNCKDTIKETLQSAEIIDRLNVLDKDLDKITVPFAVSRLRKILLKLAEDSMGKIDFNKSENPKKK